MSSKEEIRLLLTQELEATPENNECLLFKQYIKDEIAKPPIVNMNLNYVFSVPLNEEQLMRFMLCYKIMFGIDYINISNIDINIDLSKFLQ